MDSETNGHETETNGPETEERLRGPRGGVTTRTDSGMVKKNLWIEQDMGEWLRTAAFLTKKTEAHVIRLGIGMIRAHYERTGKLPEESQG